MKTYEELQDENTMLRDALGLTFKGNPEWPITSHQRKILGIIAKAGVASYERIFGALYAHKSDAPTPKVVAVHVSHMRKRLKPYGIEIKNTFGEGYWMTRETREFVLAQDGPA